MLHRQTWTFGVGKPIRAERRPPLGRRAAAHLPHSSLLCRLSSLMAAQAAALSQDRMERREKGRTHFTRTQDDPLAPLGVSHPHPQKPRVGLGARRDKARGAQSVPVRSCTQSPSPSPCLPSSSLGFVFPRVSDAPFGGRRDGLTTSPSAASSLASQPPPPRPSPQTPKGALSGLGGRQEHPPCARGPGAPAPPGRGQRYKFAQPFRHPLSGAHPIPAAVGSGPDQPHPLAAWEPSRSHAPTCAAAGAARSEGTARPGPSPAPRRVCSCAAAAAEAAAAAGWLADWLVARLAPRWGFL